MAAVETDPPVAVRSPVRWRRRATAYVALTKPRVIELLLVTTVPVMFLAARGVPDLGLVLATLVGGSLSAGGANAFNCWYDRDIDAVMHRTSARPLVTGEVSPSQALVFATILTVASTVWLWVLVNPLSAALALGATVFYVVGYTMVLKRRTTQNIVWGGAAGCMPVLIGWSSVTGTVQWPAAVLFLVVFLWTPPHYWPLSMRFVDDYAAVDVPMLPVRRSPRAVAAQILAYSWGMFAASLLLVPVASMGWVYLVATVAAGAVFLREAHGLYAATSATGDESAARPMRLFHLSITYVTVVFLAVAVDPLLHLPLR